jgi:acyl-homoserine-lactone acylase
VRGDTAAAAAFGRGDPQGEARLEDVLLGYLAARGRAASVLGEDWLERDREARIARHADVARERFGELSPLLREMLERFVAGVRAFMDEHPERVPAWGEPPEAHDPVARMRAFAWTWPWRQVLGDVGRGTPPADDGRGSNQWVVGRERSAERAVIALIDPHLPWDGLTRFHEAHVHGGDLHAFGFAIPGTPIPAVGHTDVLSIAATTGGPDTGDVYEERIHADDPLLYEYDGSWRAIAVETVDVDVAAPGGTRRETLTIERTHHGPIVRREPGRAWAARTAYDGEIGPAEQWLRMLLARSLDEFRTALAASQSLPQNLMYGDVHGELYYVRAGRVPVRPPGFSWDRPVPGWTSATEWTGTHPLADLVQLRNPPQGFLQNCNVSPGTMVPGSPLTADRFLPYLYNTRTDRTNDRGRRILDLLGADTSITVADARRFAVDTEVYAARRWQQELRAAWTAHEPHRPDVDEAVRRLLEWDGRIEADRSGATLFRYWMRACRAEGSGVDRNMGTRTEPLGATERAALVQALEAAVDEMQSRFGRLDVPWGEVHRAGRGGETWPVGGCNADGIGTLRSVRIGEPDAGGLSRVEGGQLCTTVVVLRRRGVESYSVTPYGQSDDPASPHFTDQGRLLFRHGLLKPTRFSRAPLRAGVSSTRTWVLPRAR